MNEIRGLTSVLLGQLRTSFLYTNCIKKGHYLLQINYNRGGRRWKPPFTDAPDLLALDLCSLIRNNGVGVGNY